MKNPAIQKRLGGFNKLVLKWKVVYIGLTSDSEIKSWVDDQDFESLCVGWCIAQGLTIRQAIDFYQAMIPLGLF